MLSPAGRLLTFGFVIAPHRSVCWRLSVEASFFMHVSKYIVHVYIHSTKYRYKLLIILFPSCSEDVWICFSLLLSTPLRISLCFFNSILHNRAPKRRRPQRKLHEEAEDRAKEPKRRGKEDGRGKEKPPWLRKLDFCKPATHFKKARGQPKTTPFQLSECSLSSHPVHTLLWLV